MQAAATLLARSDGPAHAEVDSDKSGNVYRYGTYMRIKAAIRDAAHATREG